MERLNARFDKLHAKIDAMPGHRALVMHTVAKIVGVVGVVLLFAALT